MNKRTEEIKFKLSRPTCWSQKKKKKDKSTNTNRRGILQYKPTTNCLLINKTPRHPRNTN